MRAWAANFYAPKEKQSVEPSYYVPHAETGRKRNIGLGYHYPIELVKMAYNFYRASGFTHIMMPDEVAAYPNGWLEDIATAHDLVEFNKPNEEPKHGPTHNLFPQS